MAKAFRYALKHSLPILISYIPVALAYGVLMQNCGYNFVWTGACSIFVLAGSLQYLMVTFFAGGVSLLTVAIMSLLLNSRQIFSWAVLHRKIPYLRSLEIFSHLFPDG